MGLEGSCLSPDGAALVLPSPSLTPGHSVSAVRRARKERGETAASRAPRESRAEMCVRRWAPPHPNHASLGRDAGMPSLTTRVHSDSLTQTTETWEGGLCPRSHSKEGLPDSQPRSL